MPFICHTFTKFRLTAVLLRGQCRQFVDNAGSKRKSNDCCKKYDEQEQLISLLLEIFRSFKCFKPIRCMAPCLMFTFLNMNLNNIVFRLGGFTLFFKRVMTICSDGRFDNLQSLNTTLQSPAEHELELQLRVAV